MAEVLPPLPGCRRLYLYEMPGEGLVNGRGMPLAGCGAARAVFLLRHGLCRRLLLRVAGAGPGSEAGLGAYGAAYFRLAGDFAGAYLPPDCSDPWLARFALDVPVAMPPGLEAFCGAGHAGYGGAEKERGGEDGGEEEGGKRVEAEGGFPLG